MKRVFNRIIQLATLLSIVLLLITSCAPEIKLTSSWTNKQAKVKSSPVIMVVVLGKADSPARQEVENNLVARLTKYGYKAVPGSGVFKPGVKQDSAEVVSILQKNSIDILLTNAVVSMTANSRFIPGAIESADIVVPSGGAAAAYGPYNSGYVGYSYYNYYNTYNYNSYQTIDAHATPGTTITDLNLIIESNLYNVSSPELIWHGQSRAFTNEPPTNLIDAFCKNVISDIRKNKLLVK